MLLLLQVLLLLKDSSTLAMSSLQTLSCDSGKQLSDATLDNSMFSEWGQSETIGELSRATKLLEDKACGSWLWMFETCTMGCGLYWTVWQLSSRLSGRLLLEAWQVEGWQFVWSLFKGRQAMSLIVVSLTRLWRADFRMLLIKQQRTILYSEYKQTLSCPLNILLQVTAQFKCLSWCTQNMINKIGTIYHYYHTNIYAL